MPRPHGLSRRVFTGLQPLRPGEFVDGPGGAVRGGPLHDHPGRPRGPATAGARDRAVRHYPDLRLHALADVFALRIGRGDRAAVRRHRGTGTPPSRERARPSRVRLGRREQSTKEAAASTPGDLPSDRRAPDRCSNGPAVVGDDVVDIGGAGVLGAGEDSLEEADDRAPSV